MSDESISYYESPVPNKDIPVIEFHMMNIPKFVSTSFVSAFAMRGIFYPLVLIRSRLQVQKQNTVYRGFFHAVKSIKYNEGLFGFYRGFVSGSMYFFTPVLYTFSLEFSRHLLTEQLGVTSKPTKGFFAGMMATVVNSLVTVPTDVVMQYNMFLAKTRKGQLSRGLDDPLELMKHGDDKKQITRRIMREIWRRDGLPGFYRGYFITVLSYGTNHGLWWSTYNFLPNHVNNALTSVEIHLPLQAIKTISAMASTVIANSLTNWIDVTRIRIQSQRMSFAQTMSVLWREEGLGMFWKGLHVRVMTNMPLAFMISIFYEWVKDFSLKPEYREEVRWTR